MLSQMVSILSCRVYSVINRIVINPEAGQNTGDAAVSGTTAPTPESEEVDITFEEAMRLCKQDMKLMACGSLSNERNPSKHFLSET